MSATMAPYIHFDEAAAERPYFPFPAAMERGLVAAPDDAVPLEAIAPGVEILNGRIPNSKNAGLVPIGQDFAAVDLAYGQLEGDRLVVAPASKDTVNSAGEFTGEGIITLTEMNGRLRVAARVFDVIANYWTLENLRQQHHRVAVGSGGLAVVAIGWDLPDFDIKDVDSQTGRVTAQQRQRFF